MSNKTVNKNDTGSNSGEILIGKVNHGDILRKIDLNDISRGKMLPLSISTITVDVTTPKVYSYEQDARGISHDAVARILTSPEARSHTLTALCSTGFVNDLLTKVTGARSGTFKTNHKIVTLPSLMDTIRSVSVDHSLPFNNLSLMATVGFFSAILNELGIIADTGSLKRLEPKSDFFLDQSAIESEIYKLYISTVLKMFDPKKLQMSSTVGVAVVSHLVTEQAQAMLRGMHNIEHKITHLETTLIMIKAYISQDYSLFTKDEIDFFDDPKFLSLASNLTLVQIALDKTLARPRSGHEFWAASIDTVDSTLKSSTIFETMSISNLKEFYRLSFVNDVNGMKKAMFISKNFKESSPLESFYKIEDDRSKVDHFWRLIKDDITPKYFSDFYSRACALTMGDVHDFAVSTQSRLVRDTDMLHAGIISVTDSELVALSASVGIKLELLLSDDDLTQPKIVFQPDTTNANIRETFSAFLGVYKTPNPLNALFLHGVDFDGSQSITNSNSVLGEVKGTSIIGAKDLVHNRLERRNNLSISGASLKVKITPHMHELLVCPPLTQTKMTKPIIGSYIYSTLVKVFSEQIEFAKNTLKLQSNSGFLVSNSISMVMLLKPLMFSSDILSMSRTTKGMFWSAINTKKQENSLARSLLTDKRIESEIMVKLTLNLLDKLEFVESSEDTDRLLATITGAGVFDHDLL